MGGAVYFCWPDPMGLSQSWQLLGTISNAKPSAIFKISKLKGTDDNQNLANSFMQLGQAARINAMKVKLLLLKLKLLTYLHLWNL